VVFGVGGAVEAGLGDFDEYQVDDDHREEQQEEGRWAWRESQQVGESGVGQDRTDQRRTGRNREHGQARSALEERYASAGGRILIVGSRGRGGSPACCSVGAACLSTPSVRSSSSLLHRHANVGRLRRGRARAVGSEHGSNPGSSPTVVVAA
jgi:hypothetical protein